MKKSRHREKVSVSLCYRINYDFEDGYESSDCGFEDRASGPKLRGNRPREFDSDNRANTTKPTEPTSSKSLSTRNLSRRTSSRRSSTKSSHEDDRDDNRKKRKKSRERSCNDGLVTAGSRKVTSSKSSTKGDLSEGLSGSKSLRHADGKRDGRKCRKRTLAYRLFKNVYDNGSKHQTTSRQRRPETSRKYVKDLQ